MISLHYTELGANTSVTKWGKIWCQKRELKNSTAQDNARKARAIQKRANNYNQETNEEGNSSKSTLSAYVFTKEVSLLAA